MYIPALTSQFPMPNNIVFTLQKRMENAAQPILGHATEDDGVTKAAPDTF